MDEQRREQAIKYILEFIEEDGYLEVYDGYRLGIIKEALRTLKVIDKWNGIGCTSFQVPTDGAIDGE